MAIISQFRQADSIPQEQLLRLFDQAISLVAIPARRKDPALEISGLLRKIIIHTKENPHHLGQACPNPLF